MPTYDVDVEGKTYEVDAPDSNTAWAWAYTTHRQQFGARPPAPPEPAEGIGQSLVRGFKAYAPQLKETVGGLGVLAGKGIQEAFGPGEISAGLIKSGVERMKAAEEQQQAMTRPGEASFTQALDKGIGTVLSEWLPYQVGSGAANLLESLALIGGGTLIGSAVAPGVGTAAGAVTGAVSKELAKKGVLEVAKKLAVAEGEEAAKKYMEKQVLDTAKDIAIKRGQTALLAGQAAGYGFGQVTSRAVQEAQERGEQPEAIELARVLPAGLVSTAAEFLSDKIGLGALKGLKKETQDQLKDQATGMLAKSLQKVGDVAKGIAVTGTKEAPTEIVQQAAERFGAKLDLTDAKALTEYMDAAAGAYAMSVVPGGIGGLRQKEVQKTAQQQYLESLPEAERETAKARMEAGEPQKAEAEAPKPVTGETGIVRPEEETPISREVTKAVEPEVAPPAVISSSVPATKMPVTKNYADMTVEALRSAKETADETNLQMDLSAIRKHFGEDAATAYAGMNRRQRNKWWDANATESFERDSSVFNGVNEETIDEYIQAYNKFDTESPQSLGRSIALIARKINDPDFIGSPEYLTLKNALSYAKEQGWSEKQVLDAMRGRASEWAGADAQELFKDLFKGVPKQAATTQTDSSLTKREELKALPPTVSPEPSIAEDRQRAEPVVEAAAPEPVVTEAAAKPEEVPSAPEVVPQEEIARPEVMPPKKEIDRQALEEKRQTILDMIETKKERREPIPEGWIEKLTEISAQLRGEKVDREEIYSMEVAGHPMFDGPPVLRNLIPIKVKNAEAAQRALDRALALEKQVATEFYGARYALQSAKNAAAKKAAQARIKKLTDQGWDDDALKTLREETIEELSRLVDAAKKTAPKAGEVRPEARVQPEGESRAAVSDEEVKKPVIIKQEQTDKERQAQINRERQQAKRAAAEAERAEKERRKAEKEAEAKRKAEAAAERERAKRKAEEIEAKRKAEKEKAKREQDRRKAEEAEAKRKAEEAEAKRKAAELPPYEQRVKLSADDLYPQLKDFDSAVNAIYDRASNPAEKEIASLIKSRVAQFKELGFAFSLRVTPEGKMLSSGALGHSVIKYSPIGEATTISIALNHPSNGDQSGTRWDTVTHELLHAVTQAQIRFAPEGSAARQLKSLFNDVVDYFNERAKAKTLTAFESRMYNGEINALRNPDELLAWGLSDKNMQSWLNGIDSKKGNFLSRLYDIVANVLGFGKSNTALAELLSVSEALLTEPVDAYITKANLRGKSFGMQKNVSDIPGWALSFADGLPVVWFEKDAALIKAESITGKTIYLVATPEGVSRGDVAGYTGNLLPPARLAEVKDIAEALRSEPEEEIRFMRSAPSPTTAGQSALDTINQLGMGVKEPEKNLYQKAKDTFKQMGESPAGTKAEIKEAVRKFFANAESKVFSPDARWDSDIKNGLRKDMKPIEDIIGASLLVSQSQAVGPDAVATRAMLIGGAKYDAEVMKWVAYENKDANEIVKAKVLDDIAAKYGLTREEASQVAHTYLVAANYEGILKRNAQLEERIEKARSKAKELEDLIPILTMRYQNAIAELGEMDLEKDARRLEREFDQLNKKTKDDITKLNNEVDDLQAALVFVSEDQAAMVEPGKAIADSIPEVKKITEIWNEQRRMVKDAMVFGGLWTPEYADALMDNAAYVPFYREKQIEADEGPRVFMRGLQVKAKEQKLKGSKTAVNDVFENMALWQQYAINRAIRNHKMVQSIDVGKTIQVGDRKMAEQVSEPKRGMNVVRLWREGKQEFYEVADPYYVEAFQSLGAVYIEPIKYFTAISNILRKTVVMYPLFSLGQLTQDSVAAIFSSGLKPQYAFKIPFLAVQEFIKTMKGWSTTHNELANYGAVGVRDFNANVAKEDAEITANIKAPKGTAGKIKYMLERIAMSADNAVRQATYIAAQDAGLSKAEALEKAFEIINFRRRGSSKLLQLMGQTVPFFYAYLSAQRVAYKTLTLSGISPTERMAALETLAQTTAAVMALSFLYAMANGDDEEYKKTPATVRDRSLIIPGSGGVRIPLRPDFFLFPKVIAEHTYQLITDEGYSDGAKFRKSMADLFANATLSPNVVPQIVKPTFEAAINYSFFEGKPIIGYFEQNKEAGRQFNESTSEFAKWLGRFGASPQMVDHLVRGYFGSVGGLALWGTNFFIEGEPGVPRPELTAHDMLTTMPGVGAFKQKSSENALKVDFYELRDAIAKAKNTYDDMKVRSPEGLEAFLQDEKNLARLAMDKQVTKIGDHLSKIRRAIQQVAAAPAERMSASEKQERIKELRDVEMELLKAVDVKAMRAQAKL